MSDLISWNFPNDALWKLLVTIAASLALVGGTAVYRIFSNIIRQSWLGNLRHYVGDYYGYRWHVGTDSGSLVEPKISIKRNWKCLWAYSLYWTTPSGTTESYRLKEHHGREIYAVGESRGLGSFSTFVIHPAHAIPVSVVSGMYFFLNNSHQFVAGPFLMSREKLLFEQVEKLLPPSAATSSQFEAMTRAWDLQDMKNRLSNIVPIKGEDRTLAAGGDGV